MRAFAAFIAVFVSASALANQWQRNDSVTGFWGPGLGQVLMGKQLPTVANNDWSQSEIQALKVAAGTDAVKAMTPFERQFLTSEGKTTCVPYQAPNQDACFYVGSRALSGGGGIVASCFHSVQEREDFQKRKCGRVLVDGIKSFPVR